MLYRSPAYPGMRMKSVARTYPVGLNLVSEGRRDLLYIRVQNRGNNPTYFWHGLIPNQAGTGFLPLLISNWTSPQLIYADGFVGDFGEKLIKDFIWEPRVAPTGPIYSLVRNENNKAMVIIGLQEDQEQGRGSFSERE